MAVPALTTDTRSAHAQEYRKYYKTKAWRWARTIQLHDEPLCEPCKAKGKVVAATTVNHRTPHKGDWALFIDPANHQSLCKPCHDGPTQQRERIGYTKDTGTDGIPTDPNHPANKRDRGD